MPRAGGCGASVPPESKRPRGWVKAFEVYADQDGVGTNRPKTVSDQPFVLRTPGKRTSFAISATTPAGIGRLFRQRSWVVNPPKNKRQHLADAFEADVQRSGIQGLLW